MPSIHMRVRYNLASSDNYQALHMHRQGWVGGGTACPTCGHCIYKQNAPLQHCLLLCTKSSKNTVTERSQCSYICPVMMQRLCSDDVDHVLRQTRPSPDFAHCLCKDFADTEQCWSCADLVLNQSGPGAVLVKTQSCADKTQSCHGLATDQCLCRA